MFVCCKQGECMRICPVSFGMALGLTGFLAVILWTAWAMFYGMSPEMAAYMPALSWWGSFVHALYALLKGFIFGFVVAFIYNCASRCCMRMCKK